MIRANAFAGTTKKYNGIGLSDEDTASLLVLKQHGFVQRQLDEAGTESDWWQVTWKTLQFHSASYVVFGLF